MKYLLIILSLFLIGCDDEDSGNSNINVEEGNFVVAAECRPLSKSVSFVVIEVRS